MDQTKTISPMPNEQMDTNTSYKYFFQEMVDTAVEVFWENKNKIVHLQNVYLNWKHITNSNVFHESYLA